MEKFLLLILCTFLPASIILAQPASPFREFDAELLPHGNHFRSWEMPQLYSHTYYVDQHHPRADDANPGTEARPFKTISQAARILKPGERVLIKGGEYRETVHPARGGEGPQRMITYEAAEGEQVVVKGSVILPAENWKPGVGWRYSSGAHYEDDGQAPMVTVWQYDLDGSLFEGYNPFGMMNILHDREWLQYQKVKMDAHFRRRGMLFLDGRPIRQVSRPIDLADKTEGAFWIEHNGLRIHVRFPGEKGPGDFLIEATAKEQVFAPQTYGLAYLHIKGITFSQAGNGFPVPQRGLVSTARGHHWIIENCTIEWANSLGLDIGNEMWHTEIPETSGYHIIRGNTIRHCGIGGLQGIRAQHCLIEDNWLEDIGWQDAEHGWESGAIKFHQALGTLIRRNIFRHIQFAPGIWLDYLSSTNCRISQNVFSDITTARGAIYVEVSRGHIRIDHNLFHQLRSQYWISGEYGAGGNALYTDGSDSITFEYNLAFDIENTGYGSYLNNARLVGGRGGTARAQQVMHNIFVDCRRYAIEFPNEHNFSDGNVFWNLPDGYLTLTNPPPPLFLNLAAWRDGHGWERNGMWARVVPEFNNQTLTLTIEADISHIPISAGPFRDLAAIRNTSVDPRRRR